MKIFRVITVCLLVFLISAPAMAETELKLPAKDTQADYDRVWDAAIDALYEYGMPISYMSKADGYLVTEKKVLKAEWTTFDASGYRVWVTLRFVRREGSIIVLIRTDAEKMKWFRNTLSGNYLPFDLWEPAGSDEGVEKLVKEKISSRL